MSVTGEPCCYRDRKSRTTSESGIVPCEIGLAPLAGIDELEEIDDNIDTTLSGGEFKRSTCFEWMFSANKKLLSNSARSGDD
jgi:hypothetical protein